MPNYLTPTQIASLRAAHRQVRDKRSADRIKAVVALADGRDYVEVATILMLDETTLRRYVKRFQEDGIDGLLECRYTGGKSELTPTQERALARYLAHNTLPTALAATTHIKKRYGVDYSLAGVTKLLHRLGFSYKKPRVIPGKMNPERQAAFIKEYEGVKASLGEHDTIQFMDATHPTHNTTPSYGWIKRGREYDVFIKTNTGRARLNLHGALNLVTLQTTTSLEETINYKTVIKTLNKLIKKQPRGKIHLIMDNAKYYHAKKVKEWRRHHTRVKFHFIPPYSPNLNIIERLWLYYHKQVTHNRYFPNINQFRGATLYFFRHLKQYETDLRRLLTDNFQTYPATAVANLS